MHEPPHRPVVVAALALALAMLGAAHQSSAQTGRGPATEDRREATASEDAGAELTTYAGEYARHLGSRRVIRLAVEDHQLVLHSGSAAVRFEQTQPNQFSAIGAPVKLDFRLAPARTSAATEPQDETATSARRTVERLVLTQGQRRAAFTPLPLLEARYRQTAGEARPHAVADAVLAGDHESLQQLLIGGADPSELDTRPGVGGRSGRRPLNWAAIRDDPIAIAALLDHGADLNATNQTGFTALHHAAEAGSPAAARLLLERGAASDGTNQHGMTPLQIALRANRADVANVLRTAAKASPTATTPLAGYEQPEALDDGLETGSLDSDRPEIDALLELKSDLEAGHYGAIDSLLIVADGKLVIEEYFGDWNRDRAHMVQSISKSMTALLVGSAIQQGHLESVDEPISKYLPDHRDELTEREDELTIKDLLTMSAGYDWDEHSTSYLEGGNIRQREVRSADPVQFTLSQPHVNEPGAAFTYSGGYVTVVGAIVANAAGTENAATYLGQSTLSKLGFQSHLWGPQAGGFTNTAGGLLLRPRDLAKVGLLMLQDGVWQGEQLLSKEFVHASLQPHLETNSAWSEYGYFFWGRELSTENGSYAIDAGLGWGGQHLVLIRELDLVVVVTATNYQSATPIESMLALSILPAFETN